jgi:hypothetical protein
MNCGSCGNDKKINAEGVHILVMLGLLPLVPFLSDELIFFGIMNTTSADVSLLDQQQAPQRYFFQNSRKNIFSPKRFDFEKLRN